MAPRNRQPQDLEEADAAAMEGFPGDGDEYDENAHFEEPAEEDEVNEPQAPAGQPPSDWQAQMAAINAQLAQSQREVAELRTRVAPQPNPSEPKDIDWGQELYNDPNGAVAKLTERIEKRLEAKYTQDTGRREFWTKFYLAHPDLETIDGFVKATLSANMGSLANLSIPEAIKQLSALTRQSMASYIQGQNKNTRRTNRAQAEGAGPGAPTARPTPTDEPAPRKTLSSMIRNRQEKRGRAA